jgi:predicted RNA polymerase sigma factor
MQWVIPALSLLLLVLVYHRIHAAEDHITEHLDRQTHHLQGAIVSEVQDAVDAITAQINKGTAEVVAEVAALEAQVAAGETPDFTALKAAAQALDDLNPDPAPEA